MHQYLTDLQKRFFTWCDNALQDNITRKGTIFKQWRPRKNSDDSYDLVLIMTARDKAELKFIVPVPKEFHGLLESEYFCNHPPNEEEEG